MSNEECPGKITKIRRWKGKFVKKSTLSGILNRVENGKKSSLSRKSKAIDKTKLQVPKVVNGNRIIHVHSFQEKMFCKACRKPLLIQHIEKETIRGLASIFKIRCSECTNLNSVETQEKYKNPSTGQLIYSINTKAVLGTKHNIFL